MMLSSVIRQKDKSQNRCYKKTKHAKFSEKGTFITPLIRKRTGDLPFCLITGAIRSISKSQFRQTPPYKFTDKVLLPVSFPKLKNLHFLKTR